VIVYAPRTQPVSATVALRLIGVLDADLVTAFSALVRGMVGFENATVIVDVRDLELFGETDLAAFVAAVRRARCEGRDVRLDTRSLAWRRIVKNELPSMPAVEAGLHSDIRRTVILAHSARKRRR
jgi:anti-anti-sigma regulatory factor